jgi:hypothetical protein
MDLDDELSRGQLSQPAEDEAQENGEAIDWVALLRSVRILMPPFQIGRFLYSHTNGCMLISSFCCYL